MTSIWCKQKVWKNR